MNLSKLTITKIDGYSVTRLDKNIASQYQNEFVDILNLIPMVSYSTADLLAEEKRGIVLYGKWNVSLALFDIQKPIGLLIAYERPAERNSLYLEPSMYVNCISIHKDYQKKGLGRKLMLFFS